MPVSPTFPGVYIEEIPSDVRTISGVSTSVTAIVGFTERGPSNRAMRVFNFGEFTRTFGGLMRDADAAYSAQQFFLNGGGEAWIVRVAHGSAPAWLTIGQESGAAAPALTITAAGSGEWGNLLRLEVDHATTSPGSTFNLTVTEYRRQGDELVPGRAEVHRNLSMDSGSGQYVENVVATSDLITAARAAPGPFDALAAGTSSSGRLGAGLKLKPSERDVSLSLDRSAPLEVQLFSAGTSPPVDLEAIATALQARVRAAKPGAPAFAGFTAIVKDLADGGKRLLLTSGTPAGAGREHSAVQVLPAASTDATAALRLGVQHGGREQEAAAVLRPAQTGTVGAVPAAVDTSDTGTLELTLTDASGERKRIAAVTLPAKPADLAEVAAALRSGIAAAAPSDPAFRDASVQAVGGRLRVVPGGADPGVRIAFADKSGTLADELELNSATVNVARLTLGVVQTGALSGPAAAGSDGLPATTATDIVGTREAKTGLFALERVDLFNLLCIPATAGIAEEQAGPVVTEALAYCRERRAFMLVDPPLARTTLDKVAQWTQAIGASADQKRNGAVYFPPVKVPDPADGFRANVFPPSGTLAGLYARTDATRGVWKAPAGTEASLANVPALTLLLTDQENGVLNQVAVNCLRVLPAYGRVAWGARTLVGSDQQASEWKYIPVRRLALYLEETLFRGTQWVVFEPNDASLWAQIRLSIGSFLHTQFRHGAFQGTSPRDAYFVKCDAETTTQDDVNRGRVNILIGFAPLRPAEFVVVQIQQMAGQLEG